MNQFIHEDHPLVTAHEFGKKTTVLKFDRESNKLRGFEELVHNTSPNQMRKQSLLAFEALQETTLRLVQRRHSMNNTVD